MKYLKKLEYKIRRSLGTDHITFRSPSKSMLVIKRDFTPNPSLYVAVSGGPWETVIDIKKLCPLTDLGEGKDIQGNYYLVFQGNMNHLTDLQVDSQARTNKDR